MYNNIQDGTTWEYEENLKLPHYVQIMNLFTLENKPELRENILN